MSLGEGFSTLPSCVSLYRDSPQPCQLGIHLTKVISSVFHCQCFCLFLFLSVCLWVKLRKHVLSGSTVEFEQTDFCQDKFIALSFPWSGAPSPVSVSFCIHLNVQILIFFWPLGGSANRLCKQHRHIHIFWALLIKQLPFWNNICIGSLLPWQLWMKYNHSENTLRDLLI